MGAIQIAGRGLNDNFIAQVDPTHAALRASLRPQDFGAGGGSIRLELTTAAQSFRQVCPAHPRFLPFGGHRRLCSRSSERSRFQGRRSQRSRLAMRSSISSGDIVYRSGHHRSGGCLYFWQDQRPSYQDAEHPACQHKHGFDLRGHDSGLHGRNQGSRYKCSRARGWLRWRSASRSPIRSEHYAMGQDSHDKQPLELAQNEGFVLVATVPAQARGSSTSTSTGTKLTRLLGWVAS